VKPGFSRALHGIPDPKVRNAPWTSVSSLPDDVTTGPGSGVGDEDGPNEAEGLGEGERR
jgi:hypothetical protein